MTGFGYACALLLAGVFVRAGAAKLARPAEAAAAFSVLGVPSPGIAARVAPPAELLLAVTLAAAPAPGGLVALVVLGGFTAVLVRAVRRGLAVPCNCFGTARTDPVSWADVVRNVLLAALALAALVDPQTGVPSVAASAAAAALFAAGAAGLAMLRRRNG